MAASDHAASDVTFGMKSVSSRFERVVVAWTAAQMLLICASVRARTGPLPSWNKPRLSLNDDNAGGPKGST